jgi:CCAAT-binding transcription factor (CBF-B/NF-YA) subunit B
VPAPDESPTDVNPKQYHRILKRRESRRKQTGTDVNMYTPRKRHYMHESRHKHAKQRKRGPGGRFLSKAERDAHAAAGGVPLDDEGSE